MNRTKILCCFMLAVAPTAACDDDGGKKPAPKASAPASPPKAKAPAPAVKLYRDETYGFTVESARTPTRSEQQVPTATGTLTGYSYMFSAPSAPGAMIVMVTPSFYDPAEGLDLDVMLENSQQGSLATMQGTLIDGRKIEQDGATGRSFRFKVSPQGQAATGYAKLLVRGETLYQVMVVGMNSAKDFQAQGDAFVESFRLEPAAPPSP